MIAARGGQQLAQQAREDGGDARAQRVTGEHELVAFSVELRAGRAEVEAISAERLAHKTDAAFHACIKKCNANPRAVPQELLEQRFVTANAAGAAAVAARREATQAGEAVEAALRKHLTTPERTSRGISIGMEANGAMVSP